MNVERGVVDGRSDVSKQEVGESEARFVRVDSGGLHEALRCLEIEEVVCVAMVLVSEHQAMLAHELGEVIDELEDLRDLELRPVSSDPEVDKARDPYGRNARG